jgi:SnoaL-like domain
MTDAEPFMQHYMEVWPSFDADRLDEAIDPEATIHHSGMPTPIRGTDEPDYVHGIKGLMPDIGLEVANWAANGDVVFVEYRMSATLAAVRSAGPGSDASGRAGSGRSMPSVAGTTSSSWRRSIRRSAPRRSPKPPQIWWRRSRAAKPVAARTLLDSVHESC